MPESGHFSKGPEGYRLKRRGSKDRLAVDEANVSIDLVQQFVRDPKFNLEVDFDLEGGIPRNIRPKRGVFRPASPPPTAEVRAEPKPRFTRDPVKLPEWDGDRDDGGRGLWFNNPYTFIPAPVRRTDDPELGDGPPVGHHRYHDGRFSGDIAVEMTVETPLLMVDAAQRRDRGREHFVYPTRMRGGRPLVPATSIKGMLRAAFEAITNSRFPVFPGHDDRLAYRLGTDDGLRMVPARVETAADGTLQVRLMTGLTNGLPVQREDDKAAIPGNLMYAAWLPMYRIAAARGARSVRHGQEVSCWLQKYRRQGEKGQADVLYYRVLEIAPCDQAERLSPAAPAAPVASPTDRHQPESEEPFRLDQGWVCITGENSPNKKYERVFFNDPAAAAGPSVLDVAEDHCRQWRELIENYQIEHLRDLRRGTIRPSTQTGGTFSRHILPDPRPVADRNAAPGQREQMLVERQWPPERELRPGTLCYVTVTTGQDGKVGISGLYPVIIGRALYPIAPDALLQDTRLEPATTREDLSPADRVFGWVNQRGPGAYRGHVRIGPAECLDDDALEDFRQPASDAKRQFQDENGLPLAILGQPKPHQARFYVAADKYGSPLAAEVKKKDGYARPDQQGLRGRKVYPHHARLPAGFWSNIGQDGDPQAFSRPPGQVFQEFLNPALRHEKRSNQNRSIESWIRPGARFRVTVQVSNLSPVELGALLWLLDLNADPERLQDEQRFHRLGGGKPLGFGSVRLAIDRGATRLARDAALKARYERLGPWQPPAFDQTAFEAAITAFKTAIAALYGRPFAELPFIKGFLVAASGYPAILADEWSDKTTDRPVHYPRPPQNGSARHPPPNPEGKQYEWFVANEKRAVHDSLPPVTAETSSLRIK